jgi:hypothetical protein
MIETALLKAQAREQKNLQFFQQHMPAIYQQLAQCDVQPALLIDPKTGRIGLPGNDSQVDIYQGDAPGYAINEVERFNQKVATTSYRDPTMPAFLPHLIQDHAFEATQQFFNRHQGHVMGAELTNLDLVVFGVGLGYHVEVLANQQRYRSITVVENDIAQFKASLYCIDWGSILTSLSNEYSVTLIVKSPGEQGKHIYSHDLRVQCVELFPSLTASTIRYTHTPVADRYEEEKRILADYSSFVSVVYEKVGPDSQRLFNALENSRRGIALLNMQDTQLAAGKPIAIIGAGPSLDIYAEALKSHRDDFYLLTVGTGLSSLLNLGLRPDAHLELEYKQLATSWISYAHEQHDLSDIDLITTIEAHPGFVGFFRQAYAFVPETSPIKALYSDPYVLKNGGVNCANAALAVCSQTTNNDIYLFGIDYAFTEGHHHSAGNISQQDDLPNQLTALKTSTRRYSRKVLSTQGHIIGTKSTLDSARLVMEDLLSIVNNSVYNCSHGAAIAGTDYIAIDQLQPTASAAQKGATQMVSSQANYQESINLIRSTYQGAFEISTAVGEALTRYQDKKDQVFRIFRIMKEIKTTCKNAPPVHQATMAINRLPIISLYKCLNNLTEEEAQQANQLWSQDYHSYLSIIKQELFRHLDGNDHYVDAEWTTLNH